MIFENEKDLLWEELNLGELLDSMKVQKQTSHVVDDAPKSEAMKKHNKMINKPSYSVLMDRYNSSPHKPTSVQAAKINKLADPIKGRYPHFDKYMNTDTPTTYDDEPVAFKKNNSGPNSPARSNSNSPMKKATANSGRKTPPAAFFLTEGMEDDAEDDRRYSPTSSRINAADKIAANKLKQGNGFAAILRSRIEEANRLERMAVPVKLETGKPQKPSIYGNRGRGRGAAAVPARGRPTRARSTSNQPKAPAAVKPRRTWQENTIVHHVRGDSNKKSLAQVVAGRKGMIRGKRLDEEGSSVERRRNNNVLRDPLTKKVKKVVSSGYGAMAGYSKVNSGATSSNNNNSNLNTSGKARERVIRKITTETPAPSVTENPNHIADIKRKLRSKDTIDVLDTIEEKRSVILQQKQRGGKAGGASSAPPGKSREKSGGGVAANNQSLDDEDSREEGRPAVRMTRKSANPPVRKQQQPQSQATQAQQKDEPHWTQKLSPKHQQNVHPNSYLAQKRDEARQQGAAGGGAGAGAGAAAATVKPSVTSQYSVVSRNIDLSSALTASSLSPKGNNESAAASGGGGVYGGESKYSKYSSAATSAVRSSGGGGVTGGSGGAVREPSVDINTTLAKLRSMEVDGGASKVRDSKNGRMEADINAQFAKQAAKLGEYFNNAEAIMNKYKNLANDLE